jgi:CBS domain-containing protein
MKAALRSSLDMPSIVRRRQRRRISMQVRDIMSSPAVTVTPAASVQEVAGLMRTHHISGMPVVDADGVLVGIINELDLIARSAPLRQPRYFAVLSGLIPVSLDEYRRYKEQLQQVLATNAGELMGRDDLEQTTISAEAPVEEALARMLDPRLTILAVVEQGKVIGVVTRTDIVRLLESLEVGQANSGT